MQMNLDLSVVRRDQGIAQVMAGSSVWATDAAAMLAKFLLSAPVVFTVEDFKLWALSRGLRHPHHVNAWGGMTKTSAWKDRVRATGQYRQAASIEAHARAVRVWSRK